MKLMVIVEGISRPYDPNRPFEKVRKVIRSSEPQVVEDISVSNKETLTQSETQVNAYKKSIKPPTHEKVFLIKDIMNSPVISVTPETSLKDAWTLMCEKKLRHLIVCQQDKKIAGIFSERDLLRNSPFIHKKNNQKEAAQHKVKDIMSHQVLSAFEDAEIREVAHIMFNERVGCLPVIDHHERLVGIVTRSDILRVVMNQASLDLYS